MVARAHHFSCLRLDRLSRGLGDVVRHERLEARLDGNRFGLDECGKLRLRLREAEAATQNEEHCQEDE